MERTKTIETFSILGECMRNWGESKDKSEINTFVADEFNEKVESTIKTSIIYNGWFSENYVRQAFLNLGKILNKEELTQWLDKYPVVSSPKNVGLILPGNIPMVGFSDIFAVIFSGNKAIIKLSRDDDKLIPLLLEIITYLQPELSERFQIVERIKNVDSVIATGSNNSARYFEKYFGHLPNIIRKNRTSLAVLTGNESIDELNLLGRDLFDYYGLGCRNVTHLLLPKGYDLNNIFGAIVDYGEVINNNKYGNNYDYYKAIYLMNQVVFTDNGFVLFKETTDLFSPVAVVHYHFYELNQEIEDYIEQHKDELQVIIGKNYEKIGNSQSPSLTDYADGIDTMSFLSDL